MGSVVLTTLSIFLGLFFVFVGILKVTPQVSREMHREIRRNFVAYSKVFPFATAMGLKVSPKSYRIIVGAIEFFAGLMLAMVPGFSKQLANVVLLVLTLIALYTHVRIEDKFDRTAPSIVFSLMLTCRLIVYWQVSSRESKTPTINKPAPVQKEPLDANTSEKKEN